MEPNKQSPGSPRSPPSHKRKSVIGLFDALSIEDAESPSSPVSDSPTRNRGKHRASITSKSDSPTSSVEHSLLRKTFRRGWPPSLRGRKIENIESSSSSFKPTNLTLKMSDLYRVYGDNWASSPTTVDTPADVRDEFGVVTEIMAEIQKLVGASQFGGDAISEVLLRDMAAAVYGSNWKARKGLGLDETITLCMAIFEGKTGIEYSERPAEYQAKLDQLIQKDIQPGQNHVIRTRREVVQHAAAFQHLVSQFVKDEKPMSEALIQETHAILVKGISGEAAGVLSSKEFGGVYRTVDVYVGTHRFPRPARIRENMRSMVSNLEQDLAEAEKLGQLDPFAIAAKYCDRFVNIHPFRDGNGRMCRLILNAILIRYAGIVVNVGEHDQSRDEYIGTARESREVGGHAGALATLVLKEGRDTLRRMRNRLKEKFL